MQSQPNTRTLVRPLAMAVCAWAFSLAAVAAPTDANVISKVDPEFPREALQAGAEKGKVKARMTVDSAGEVTRVEILDAAPRRVFDRAVVKTLSQWRFNAGIDGRLVEIDVNFSR